MFAFEAATKHVPTVEILSHSVGALTTAPSNNYKKTTDAAIKKLFSPRRDSQSHRYVSVSHSYQLNSAENRSTEKELSTRIGTCGACTQPLTYSTETELNTPQVCCTTASWPPSYGRRRAWRARGHRAWWRARGAGKTKIATILMRTSSKCAMKCALHKLSC